MRSPDEIKTFVVACAQFAAAVSVGLVMGAVAQATVGPIGVVIFVGAVVLALVALTVGWALKG